MPRVVVTYANYMKKDLDNKLEKIVGKLIAKVGFGKNGVRVVSFNFLSEKAAKTMVTKLREYPEITSAVVEG